jgi:hypothetical protein
MANVCLGNKVYIDSTGAITNLPDRPKVAYIIFTPNASGDSVTLRETSSGSDIIYVAGATAHQTQFLFMPECPLLFNNGIYVQAISASAKLIFVLTSTQG